MYLSKKLFHQHILMLLRHISASHFNTLSDLWKISKCIRSQIFVYQWIIFEQWLRDFIRIFRHVSTWLCLLFDVRIVQMCDRTRQFDGLILRNSWLRFSKSVCILITSLIHNHINYSCSFSSRVASIVVCANACF